MRAFISIIFLLITIFAISTCTFFDPMMGYTFPVYEPQFTLSFTGGNPALMATDGLFSYDNVAFDGTNVYLSYATFDKDESLIFARSKDAGHTWEKTELLHNNPDRISMALRNGVLAIACITVNDSQLYSFVSKDGGNSFIKTKIAAAPGTGDCYTGVDCFKDATRDLVFISYSDQDGTGNFANLRVVCSKDGGKSYLLLVGDDSPIDPQLSSSVSYDSTQDQINIIYQFARTGGVDLNLIRASGPDFLNPTSSTVVLNTDCWSNSIISDANHIDLLYRTGPSYRSSDNGGSTFTSPVDIDNTTSSATDVYMTKDGAALYAVFYDSTNHQVKMAKGPSFSSSASVVAANTSDGGATGRKCSIAANGSTMFVSFVDNQSRLMLSKSTNGGANWNND